MSDTKWDGDWGPRAEAPTSPLDDHTPLIPPQQFFLIPSYLSASQISFLRCRIPLPYILSSPLPQPHLKLTCPH